MLRSGQLPKALRHATVAAIQTLALLTLGAGNPASGRLQLTWSAPDGCPSTAQVLKDVDDLLANGRVTDQVALLASGVIRRNPDGHYSLVLTAKGQSRRIEGENCVELAQAAALLLALLIDPSRADVLSEAPVQTQVEERESEPEAVPPVSEQSRAKSASASTPQDGSATAPPQNATTRPLAEVALRLDVGNWPDARPGVVLGLGLSRGSPQVLLHGSLSQPLHLRSSSGGTLRLFVSAFDLMLMYHAEFGRWGVAPGAGAELGLVQATSQELEPASRFSLSMSVLGAIRGSFRAAPLARLWIEAGAGYPVVRPRWVVESGEELHRLTPFLRAQAGLQAEF